MKSKWDGKSRISNKLFRKNFDEIFGKKEDDELKESYQQSIKNKKERIGRNPKTMEDVIISERNVLKFKPSKMILDYINKLNDTKKNIL